MPTAILEASAAVSSTCGATQRNLQLLTEKLISLRYLITLTARWAGSEIIALERRKQMNHDLVRMRREYSFLIDDIAMNFSITAAMNAQNRIESELVVPAGI